MLRFARRNLVRAPLLWLALSILLLPAFAPAVSSADESGDQPSKPQETVAGQEPVGAGGEEPNGPAGEGDPDDLELPAPIAANVGFAKYYILVF